MAAANSSHRFPLLLLLPALLLGALLAAGCQRETTPPYEPRYSPDPPSATESGVYLFGVHPLHNPQRLFEVYQPLVDYLNRRLNGPILKLEASRDYPTYDERLFSGQFQFALPNPYETLESLKHGYRVFAKVANDDGFRGIILVRKDSGIERVTDLRGKAVSYPAPSALAATMLPQWYLQSHGLEVLREVENRYVGSQESSIMNVYLGHTAAGATWPTPWREFVRQRPELAEALEVKWATDSLPNIGVVAREDVPPALVAQVRDLLLGLEGDPEGRTVLEPTGLGAFAAAENAAYEPVRKFIHDFESAIRPPREER